jgi:hypothetical protein
MALPESYKGKYVRFSVQSYPEIVAAPPMLATMCRLNYTSKFFRRQRVFNTPVGDIFKYSQGLTISNLWVIEMFAVSVRSKLRACASSQRLSHSRARVSSFLRTFIGLVYSQFELK